MVNTKFFRSKTFHYILSLCILIFLVYLQSTLLAKIPSVWFHIDVVSIAIVYVSIEHYLPFAFTKVLFTALLMQANSAAPSGFYVMYFLLILVLANFLSRILIFRSVFGQFSIFLNLYILKYFLFYFSIFPRDIYFFVTLLLSSWQGFLLTILLSLPLFKVFIFIDSFFEVFSAHDKKKLIDF